MFCALLWLWIMDTVINPFIREAEDSKQNYPKMSDQVE